MDDISENVRANWILISDPQDSNDAHYYDRVELYSGCFDSVSPNSHQDKVFVVGGSFGGPVLVLENKLLTIFSAAGEKISESRWSNGLVISAGWSDKEEAVFVQENGKVLVYSMFGNFKYEVNMGEEASINKIHSAKIFPSSRGTGVAVLTGSNNFFSVQNIEEPKLRKLHDFRSPGGQDNISTPNSWCPLARDKQERLVVARDSDLVLLSANEFIPLEVKIQDPERKQAEVLFVATSPSQDKICAVMDNGRVWMGTEHGEITTAQTNSLPSDLVWCGEEAVLLAGFPSILLHQSGGMETIWLESSLVCVVQECDGVRIIRQGGHDLIHKVNDASERIFKIASPESGSLLLQASQELKQKSHKADELLRMIKDNMMQLRESVTQCISAAGALFIPEHQKELLSAAKFGTAFMEAGITTEKFYNTCESLKILNNVRHMTVGIPLTQPQLEALGVRVLIDRLIARRLFAFAIKVAEFKKLPPGEGRSRILAHWAMYKVEAPSKKDEKEIANEINSRLNQDPEISYSDIAEIAMKCEKTRLAEMLLEHEVRADRQVPLLMKMGKGGKVNAIQKAIQSGDTDMIYHVILTLRNDRDVKASEFHMIVRKYPEASKLYSLFCRQYESHDASLADWLQQEDDLGAMARLSFAESFSSGRIESRMAHLVTAQGQFKRAREDFSAGMAEEQHRLLNNQSRLEEKMGKPFLNLSLHETLKLLLKEGEAKTADKLRAEFKINDRKYYWIKIRAFGESKQWTELLHLAKSKKSPIGVGPFIDQCLKYDEKGQATKYLDLLSQEEKLKYYDKLDLLQEAADTAFALRNMEALSALEAKANQTRNHSLLDVIASYKQRLLSSR